MRLSEEQMKKLLEYRGRMAVKHPALSMTVTRFKRLYQAGVQPAPVSRRAAELNLIVERTPANMKPDYERIAALCRVIRRNDIPVNLRLEKAGYGL